MAIQLIDDNLLLNLYKKASFNERLQQAFDLRTTRNDRSQRMLNALQLGIHVPIHKHLKSAETNICLDCCLDVVSYNEVPNMVAGRPVHDGERALDETLFREAARFRLCPREKKYGIQIPAMCWHTIEVYVGSTIFEAKDGAYGK